VKMFLACRLREHHREYFRKRCRKPLYWLDYRKSGPCVVVAIIACTYCTAAAEPFALIALVIVGGVPVQA
jgi:hypothetical protein